MLSTVFWPGEGQVHGQTPFEDWLTPHAAQGMYMQGKSVTDASANVYQVGATLNASGGYDGIVTKIDKHGVQQWSYTYDGGIGGNDYFTDVVWLPSGSLALTGVGLSGNQGSSVLLAQQLSASTGQPQWTETYTYPSSVYNGGAAITADPSGNLYIAGATHNWQTLSDMLAVSYSPSGVLQWATAEDYNSLHDGGVKLAYADGRIQVLGGAQVSADTWRYATTSLTAATGAVEYSVLSGSSMSTMDVGKDMVLDSDGNIYITGTAGTATEGYNMYTVKLSDELEVLWDHSYNHSSDHDDVAHNICLDASGNVIIAGYTDLGGGNTQMTAVKYSENGIFQNDFVYNVSSAGDTALAVVADGQDHIYLSGTFYNGSNQEVKTIKYSPTGTLLWEIDYNGLHNGDDTVLDMVHDGDDLVIMVQTETPDGLEYKAIKYRESGYESPEYPTASAKMPYAFARNHGQIINEDGESTTDLVHYHAKTNGSYYRTDGLDYIRASMHGDSTLNDTLQKVALSFASMSSHARLLALEKASYFENHYVPYSPYKLERIPHYATLLYTELWEGIDLEVGISQGAAYSFSVDPKGRASDIKIAVDGADSVSIGSDGTLYMHTFQGAISWPRPRVYQTNGTGQLSELPWSPAYHYSNGTVRLDSIGNFDTNKMLWVRVERGSDTPMSDGFCHSTYISWWATDDEVRDATVSEYDGSSFLVGKYPQNIYWDVSIGSSIYVGELSGESSTILRFNYLFLPEFQIIVSGSDRIDFNAVEVLDETRVLVTGSTSASDLMMENDNPENALAGSSDGVIYAFNHWDGELVWSTYFGGIEGSSPISEVDETISDVIVFPDQSFAVVGHTVDPSDFPLVSNGVNYEGLNTEGVSGFIAKFGSDMTLEWSTLYGGSGADRILGAAAGSDGRLAIFGHTTSSDLDIQVVAQTDQRLSLAGSSDWFLAEFGDQGQWLWGTYDGSAADETYRELKKTIAYDGSNHLYSAFNVPSTSGIDYVNPPLFPNALFIDDDFGAGAYAVLTKRDAVSKTPLWRTNLMDGNTAVNEVNSLIVSENKLVLGGKTSDASLQLVSSTPSIYSGPKVANPGSDGYVMVLEKDNYALLHSTYFGGNEGVLGDEVVSVGAHPSAGIFVFGNTLSNYYYDAPGIPVFYNGSTHAAWYQDELDIELGGMFEITQGMYGFRWCTFNTPLNNSDIYSDSQVGGKEPLIHPNPVSRGASEVWLSITDRGNDTPIYIYDLQGRLVDSRTAIWIPNLGYRVPVGALSPGIYLVGMSDYANMKYVKLVIN